MRKGATTGLSNLSAPSIIVALRNEKGSYNIRRGLSTRHNIVALRNEKGSYNPNLKKP